MGRIPLLNIKGEPGLDGTDGVDGVDGPEGPVGPIGPRGLPGVNAVSNDEATATLLSTPSQTASAFSAQGQAQFAGRRAAAPVALSGPLRPVAGRDYPTLKKPLNAAVITLASQTSPTLYWPWGIDMRAYPGFGKNFGYFYSTDHSSGAGGIYAIGMDDPFGTNSVNLGRVYVDTAGGAQTETPSIYELVEGGLAMVYQQGSLNTSIAAAPQASILATSTTGLTWSRQGVMLDVSTDINVNPGPGHTGYLRPFRYGGRYYGYSLYTGGSQGYKALWTSQDGRNWVLVRILGRQTEQIVGLDGFSNDWQWSWINSAVILWQGRVWMFSQVGPTTSGADAGVAKKVYVAPLTDDLCALASPPIDVSPPAQSWEGDGIEQLGNVFEWNNRLYLGYRTSQTGGFGVMEVELN